MKKNRFFNNKFKKFKNKNKIENAVDFFFQESNFKNCFNEDFLIQKFYDSWNNFNYLNFYAGLGINFIFFNLLRRRVNFFLRKFNFLKKRSLYLTFANVKLYKFFKVTKTKLMICYGAIEFILKFSKNYMLAVKKAKLFFYSICTAVFLKNNSIIEKIEHQVCRFDLLSASYSVATTYYEVRVVNNYKKNLKHYFFYKRFLLIYKKWQFFKKLKALKKSLKFFNNRLAWFYLLNFLSLNFYKNLTAHYNLLPVSYLKFNNKHLNLLRNKEIVKAVYLRFYEGKIPEYFYFLNYFLKSFFENLFMQKVQFNFFFLESLLNKLRKRDFFKITFFRLKRFQSQIGRGFFLEEALEVIWLTFLLKDSFFFLNWFVKTIKRISFKRHKKFLSFLKLVFLKFFSKILKFFKCCGFLFKLKGKIGVSGNAKKRKFFFSKRRYSFTRKDIKMTFYKVPLTTHTGALGAKFLISFL